MSIEERRSRLGMTSSEIDDLAILQNPPAMINAKSIQGVAMLDEAHRKSVATRVIRNEMIIGARVRQAKRDSSRVIQHTKASARRSDITLTLLAYSSHFKPRKQQ